MVVDERCSSVNVLHRRYCRSAHWRHAIENDIVPWVLRDVGLGSHVLEVGPGPGVTTDVLARHGQKLTAIEIDPLLAENLERRFVNSNVTIQRGDATAMPFSDRSFSGAVAFTMLHHVPTAELQDRLLREVRRVLAPGATFAGSDSRPSLIFRLGHVGDTMVLVDPQTFGERLQAAGFVDVSVEQRKSVFRFRAVVPRG